MMDYGGYIVRYPFLSLHPLDLQLIVNGPGAETDFQEQKEPV